MGRNNKKLETRDKHHIIPCSRGGASLEDNLTLVGRKEHQVYHELFNNRTPTEITEYLVRVFWKNKWEYIKEAYERYSPKI